MFGKLSVRKIITGHFATLVNYGTGRTRPLDVATFTALPLLVSLLAIYPGVQLSADAVRLVSLPALIITAGLPLLLLIVYRVASALDSHRPKSKLERQFTEEICSNIFYTMLAGVMTAAFACLTLVPGPGIIRAGAGAALLFTSTSFFLALLMVLNRTHVLITKTCAGDDSET